MSSLHIVLLGPPGSGKGTLCEKLCVQKGLVHISTGDLLRSEVAVGSATGLKVKGLIASGQFVPDDIICDMVVRRLAQSDCVSKGWVLDGFPRTVPQVKYLASKNVRVDVTLLLHLDGEILVGRMENRRMDPATNKIYNLKNDPPTDPAVVARLVQREDDRPETIRERMAKFKATRNPILEAIVANRCHVVHLNAGGKPSDILRTAVEQLMYFTELMPKTKSKI